MTPLLLLLACADPPAGQNCPTLHTWYLDQDGDGYGAGEGVEECVSPAGYVSAWDDCDDGDAEVHPYGTETCNGVDDDCDGEVDPDSSADAIFCYVDQDGDGFGVDTESERACTCGSGLAIDKGDCDDDDTSAYPGATETWYDGIDSDCAEDEDFDADGDGYLWLDAGGDDCDDGDPDVHPGADEICGNGIDEDCDDADPESDCGVVGDVPVDGASTVISNSVQGYYAYAVLYAGDNDGDGVDEVLSARYATLDEDEFGTQAIYAVHNLPPGGDLDVIDDAVAIFEPPGWEWDASSEALSPLANCYNPAVTGTDLDGDGYQDFLLGSANGSAGAPDGIVPSRVDLWYGPATGIIDLSEADTVLGEAPHLAFGVPLTLTAADGAGTFQVAASGPYNYSVNDFPGVYLLDQATFAGEASVDQALAISKPANWAFAILTESGDFDGDGLTDFMLKAGEPDRLDENFVFAMFPGPLDSDLTLGAAEMIIDLSTGSLTAGGLSFDFVLAILDAQESPDGVAHLAMMGGAGDCDAGEECGGVWVHDYAPGMVSYDEGSGVHLVGPPDTRAGDNLGFNGSWGGDLDGDDDPELMVYCSTEYETGEEGGGWSFVVEVPESGTYDLVDLDDAYLTSTDSWEQQRVFSAVTLTGHDFNADGFDDLVTTSLSAPYTDDPQGRIYLFPGGTGDY